MDEVFIQALITQALTAYKTGGSEALERWINALPLPQQEEFRKYCAKPLQQALDSIGQVRQHFDDTVEVLSKEPAVDPRQQHKRDRRRTKPL